MPTRNTQIELERIEGRASGDELELVAGGSGLGNR